MQIQIDKDYMIATDNLCWIVKKYSGIDKATSKQKWEAQTYHPSPGAAMQALADRMIRNSHATNFLDAIKDVHAIAKTFENALSITIPENDYEKTQTHKQD